MYEKRGKSRLSIFVILVVLGLAAYFYSTVQTAKQQNNQLRATVAVQQEQYRLAEEAHQALTETKLRITRKNGAVIQRIKNAKASDDAPIAPVLKQTLEALE